MKATLKQLSFIQEIQDTLGIVFEGTTLEEAKEFISKNIKNFKHQKELDNIDNFTIKYM